MCMSCCVYVRVWAEKEPSFLLLLVSVLPSAERGASEKFVEPWLTIFVVLVVLNVFALGNRQMVGCISCLFLWQGKIGLPVQTSARAKEMECVCFLADFLKIGQWGSVLQRHLLSFFPWKETVWTFNRTQDPKFWKFSTKFLIRQFYMATTAEQKDKCRLSLVQVDVYWLVRAQMRTQEIPDRRSHSVMPLKNCWVHWWSKTPLIPLRTSVPFHSSSNVCVLRKQIKCPMWSQSQAGVFLVSDFGRKVRTWSRWIK